MPYEEAAELTRYIRRYHSSLFSRFEQRVEKAAWAREKYASATDDRSRHLMDRYGELDDGRINAALAGGPDSFRRSVVDRILSEHPDLHFNRCPRCSRILRTPQARQCFWCGHDWHRADA